jgi:hypothetical protein
MSKFPATRTKLEEAGYTRSNYSRCGGCRAAIEWWQTPKAKSIIMNPMPDPESAAISHFATCPEAKKFRKAKP